MAAVGLLVTAEGLLVAWAAVGLAGPTCGCCRLSCCLKWCGPALGISWIGPSCDCCRPSCCLRCCGPTLGMSCGGPSCDISCCDSKLTRGVSCGRLSCGMSCCELKSTCDMRWGRPSCVSACRPRTTWSVGCCCSDLWSWIPCGSTCSHFLTTSYFSSSGSGSLSCLHYMQYYLPSEAQCHSFPILFEYLVDVLLSQLQFLSFQRLHFVDTKVRPHLFLFLSVHYSA